MGKSRFFLYICFAFLLPVLNACSYRSINQTPILTQTPTPIPTQTPTPIPTQTPTPIPTQTLKFVIPTNEMLSFTVVIPTKNLSNSTQEEIAQQLFSLWLDHFTSDSVSDSYRLDDYKINKVEIQTKFQRCINYLGFEYSAAIDFSVQKSVIPCPNWDAGNGEIGTNRWINNKLYFIAVFKNEDTYSFKLKGFPPCDGIAIGTP